ncbi:MAG: S8/S53 family peptidase [Proteobacteria bacterium]|nr:S8/S53 family peptidase [Pseudomonadota bacterium]
MPERWRVAVLDSGLAPGHAWPVIARQRFSDHGDAVRPHAAQPDPSGHGTAVCAAICSLAAPVDLMLAQVFSGRSPATAAAVAAALDWAVAGRAQLIHMSLGLREDRLILAQATAAAVAAGCIVVASTPARGTPTFPALYAGVIGATADARCAAGEISALSTAQADFGGCPRYAAAGTDATRAGGASLGAAHLTAFLLSHVEPGTPVDQARERLIALARYRGPECRSARPAARDP